MAKGTSRIRASDRARSVLPEPVGPDEQDVALLDLDVAELRRNRGRVPRRLAGLEIEALVVVVDRDREDLLRVLLADHVVVQHLLDAGGLDHPEGRLHLDRRLLHLAVDDRLADVDARVADVDAGPGDDLLHLRLRLPAEGAQRHA
jgi:hypothetical protein